MASLADGVLAGALGVRVAGVALGSTALVAAALVTLRLRRTR